VSQRQYDVEKFINKLIYKFQCTILRTFYENIINLFTHKKLIYRVKGVCMWVLS